MKDRGGWGGVGEGWGLRAEALCVIESVWVSGGAGGVEIRPSEGEDGARSRIKSGMSVRKGGKKHEGGTYQSRRSSGRITWFAQGERRREMVALRDFRYSSTHFEGNEELVHSRILSRVGKNCRYFLHTFCLSLTINGSSKLLPIRPWFSGPHHLIWCNSYEGLSWIPLLQTSHCLSY